MIVGFTFYFHSRPQLPINTRPLVVQRCSAYVNMKAHVWNLNFLRKEHFGFDKLHQILAIHPRTEIQAYIIVLSFSAIGDGSRLLRQWRGHLTRHSLILHKRNSHAYGTYWPSFQSPFLENMGVVLYNKGYQMIELFILLQLIQVLTPDSNLINFYKDQKEEGVRTSMSHK